MNYSILKKANINIDSLYADLKMECMLYDFQINISKNELEDQLSKCFREDEEEIDVYYEQKGMKTVYPREKVSRKLSNITLKPFEIIKIMCEIITLSSTDSFVSCVIVLVPILYDLFNTMSIPLSRDEINVYIALCNGKTLGKDIGDDNIVEYIHYSVDPNITESNIFDIIQTLADKKIIDITYGKYSILEDYKL